MNISVYLPNSEEPITYEGENISYSTGYTLAVDPSKPQFFDTGELWIYKMIKDPTSGKLLRYNIDTFPRGAWRRVKVNNEPVA